MARRRRRLNPATSVVLIVAAGLVCFSVLPPWLESLRAANELPMLGSTGMSLAESIRDRLMSCLASLWIFFVGSAIGSFLNVVVYRMPRGESIVWRPSRCPFCATSIRPIDNVPVLGWLGLRGRCHSCRLPISSRYPVVEFVTGATFLLLAMVELLSGGANLPGRPPNVYTGFAFIIFEPQWDLIRIYLFHTSLLCILLTWSLIEYDGKRAPWRFICFALGVGLLGPAIFPDLHPTAWIERPEWWPNAWLQRFDTSLIGIACGLIAGAGVAPRGQLKLGVAACAVIGAFLGWQTVISVALVAALLGLASRFLPVGDWRRQTVSQLFIASFAQLCVWKGLSALHYWPGPGSEVAGLFGIAFLSLIAALRPANETSV